MKFRILTFVLALVVLLNIQAMPVKAFDISNGGLAFGVTGNFSNFDTSGTEREGNASNTNSATESETTSISKDVEFTSVFAEYNLRGSILHGIPGLTLGIEVIPGEAEIGAKSRTDTANDSDETGGDDGTYTAKASLSDHVSFYVEPTVYAGKYFGLYGKAAWSRVTVKTQEKLTLGTDSSGYDDKQVWGNLWGFGIRATTPWGIFVKAEYTETDYGKIQLDSNTGNKNRITASPDQDSTRVMIGFMV